MSCMKILTNGRISLTKPLTSYEQTLLTPHTQRTQSTNQLISMLSAAVLPFQSTEMPDIMRSGANFTDESTKPDDFVLSELI